MLGVLLSCTMTVFEQTPQAPPQEGVGAELSAELMWQAMSLERYLEKVDRAEAFYEPILKKKDSSKPLIVVLGGSSSGGMRRPDEPTLFWPDWLAKGLPNYEVQSLAFGGATTWHLNKLMERLDVRAHTCILYAGHNDRMRSAPKQSLGSLERKEDPQTQAFAYWVDVDDAHVYLDEMALRCGYLVAMEEYRHPDDGEVKAFARLLMRHPKVVHLEAVHFLDKYGPKVVLQDQIHLNPYGHEILGSWIAEELDTIWKENEKRD
ncbi:MAG: hypothetical protein CMK59_13870 [Proteobacteria bacterium]|nr:hypothetical protein [Pseudomonadota bacterium]